MSVGENANARNGNMRNRTASRVSAAASKNKEHQPRVKNNNKSLESVPGPDGAAARETTFLLHTMELINGIESDKFHSSLFSRCCWLHLLQKVIFSFSRAACFLKRKFGGAEKAGAACQCVYIGKWACRRSILRACNSRGEPRARYCFALPGTQYLQNV